MEVDFFSELETLGITDIISSLFFFKAFNAWLKEVYGISAISASCFTVGVFENLNP